MKNTVVTKYGHVYFNGDEEVAKHATLVSYNDAGNVVSVQQFGSLEIGKFHRRVRSIAHSGPTITVEKLTPDEPWSVRYILIEDMTLVQLLWSDEQGYPERMETYNVTVQADFRRLANDLHEAVTSARIII